MTHLSKPQVINRAEDTLSIEFGNTFQIFGRRAVWDQHCVQRETALRQVSLEHYISMSHIVLLRWRNEGDPLCDNALQELFPDGIFHGSDLFQRLESAHTDEGSATARFWDSIHEYPPESIRITEKQVNLARTFFIDHSIQIMQALLYYSLAGGFASPRIVRTLHRVSYLIPTNVKMSQTTKDRTFRRLLETFQFVLQVMRCVLPAPEQEGLAYLSPGGDGWEAIIRVRMLHGVARARARRNSSDAIDGIPINQEDMNGTLASFSTVPIWALRQLGLSPCPEEQEAYLAVWRHAGFYLGVSPASLEEHFSSVNLADQFLLSASIHLFLDDTDLEDRVEAPTMAMLQAISGQPPLESSIEFNCAVTRFLLGPELATYLGVPQTPWRMSIRLRVVLFLQAYPVLFSKFYGSVRPGWLDKRRYVYAVGMAMALRRRLGMRQTKYRPVEGELEQAVWEDESVTPDYTAGLLLGRYWRQMMAEMMAGLVKFLRHDPYLPLLICITAKSHQVPVISLDLSHANVVQDSLLSSSDYLGYHRAVASPDTAPSGAISIDGLSIASSLETPGLQSSPSPTTPEAVSVDGPVSTMPLESPGLQIGSAVSDSVSGSSHGGAIAGGVVGAIVVAGIAAVLLIRHRNKRSARHWRNRVASLNNNKWQNLHFKSDAGSLRNQRGSVLDDHKPPIASPTTASPFITYPPGSSRHRSESIEMQSSPDGH
ncbi:hypothetical protein D9757_004282 [Collybiopsis confluens]|uniref:ER-bound oxygenase mpaB/mpaB'/Rubber oxygenase catalytic domain-containing protein n=1 Tax=Collybiopsis confluens TaxID=2823264 RepID=A0A8H5MD13_9AGAR|nr:hypothetical protein D9757_004282 [Collybiopsis confluens]